ncbi:MAG: terminase small subunit [Deltaproteobacteria bacterium]|nr:terminase small subunit [Deltaproteobacteria bacterium]MBW2334508.1 terminase small subunit [Deltaproteobacteria bacterium]
MQKKRPKKSAKKIPKKTIKKSAKKAQKKRKKQDNKKCTPKQEGFCIDKLKTGNATEAYRRNYSTKNMKPETINRAAKELMDNPKITARCKELMQPVLKAMDVTVGKTLLRLMQGQEFDVRKLYKKDDKGNAVLKEPHELDDHTAKAVVGVKYDKDTGELTEYKIIDVKGCAELLGKHQKLFTEKVEEKITERTVFITEKEQTEVDSHIDESLKE